MKRITYTFLIIFLFSMISFAQFFPKIELISSEGKNIPLDVENLSGIKNRPLLKTKEHFDQKYYDGFFLLYKVKAEVGSDVLGKYTLERGPLRITVYEISKEFDSLRMIRVLATGFYTKGSGFEFRTKIRELEEHIFFITAEAADSEAQLNPLLDYLHEQSDEIILRGYSSNLSLSKLKFKLSGKDEMKREVEFTKNFDWLVSQLKNPVRIISIRVEAQ